jgi:hypothetical protein
VAEETNQPVPLALLNNLGILELESNRPFTALKRFVQALSLELQTPVDSKLVGAAEPSDRAGYIKADVLAVLGLADQMWQHYHTGMVMRQKVREHGEMRMNGGAADILQVLRENIDRARVLLPL